MGLKLANQLNRGETKKTTTSGTEEILSGDGASDVVLKSNKKHISVCGAHLGLGDQLASKQAS